MYIYVLLSGILYHFDTFYKYYFDRTSKEGYLLCEDKILIRCTREIFSYFLLSYYRIFHNLKIINLRKFFQEFF